MARLGRPRMSDEMKSDLWRRWKSGELISVISRGIGKPPGSVFTVLKHHGGIATLGEREEISRRLCAGDSYRAIAAQERGLAASSSATPSASVAATLFWPCAPPDQEESEGSCPAVSGVWATPAHTGASSRAVSAFGVPLRSTRLERIMAGAVRGRPTASHERDQPMTITGKYEMTSSDNYEEYLKAIGVGMATRKLDASSKPTVEFQESGDDFKMKTTTTFKTIDLAFTLGKEFTEETSDGRQCQTTVTRNGNTLVQVQKLEGMTSTVARTFADDGFEATFEAGGVVSKRSYKRV